MVKHALCSVASALMLALMFAVLGALALATVLAVAAVLLAALGAGGWWAAAAGIVVVGALAAVGAWLLVRRRQKERSGAGVSVVAEVQPLFWVEVNRVAEGLGIRSPDEVLLFAHADVAASGRRTRLGPRTGGRRLHLGVALLTGLTERQLRAVVADAFTRSWGPISLAQLVRVGQGVLGWVGDRVGEDSTVARIVGWYGRTFAAVSSPVTHRYELALDRRCADLAGNRATMAALSEAAVLRAGWGAFVDGYAGVAQASGRRPDVFDGFRSFLAEPGRREQLAASAAGPAPDRPWAHELQLSLADRLAAVSSLPDDGLHDRSGPALSLLRYPEQTILEVEKSMFGGPERAVATWEDIMPQAARDAACEDALELSRLAQKGGLGPTLSVEALLELISFGLVDEVVRPLSAKGAPPEAGRLTGSRLVTGFLATAAIESGTAGYRFSWTDPHQLVDEHGTVDDLPLLVDQALAEENNISALERWLRAHRVDPELELGAESGGDVPHGLSGLPADVPVACPTVGRSEDPGGSLRPSSVSQPAVLQSGTAVATDR